VLRVQAESAEEIIRAYSAFWAEVTGLSVGSMGGPATAGDSAWRSFSAGIESIEAAAGCLTGVSASERRGC
jgi:hypothetical protein